MLNTWEFDTHNVVNEDKLPIDGGNSPLKLLTERSLFENFIKLEYWMASRKLKEN